MNIFETNEQIESLSKINRKSQQRNSSLRGSKQILELKNTATKINQLMGSRTEQRGKEGRISEQEDRTVELIQLTTERKKSERK